MINNLVAIFSLTLLFSSPSALAAVNDQITDSVTQSTPVADKPKTKQVCKDVVKNGKTTKQCKTIKIHKKLEGTKVPPEKKK
jgi:hypothetical protein